MQWFSTTVTLEMIDIYVLPWTYIIDVSITSYANFKLLEPS
jgi:hypothetical protein